MSKNITFNFKDNIINDFVKRLIQLNDILCCYSKKNSNNIPILIELYTNIIQFIENLQNNINTKITNNPSKLYDVTDISNIIYYPNNIYNMITLEDYITEEVSNLYNIINKFAHDIKNNSIAINNT